MKAIRKITIRGTVAADRLQVLGVLLSKSTRSAASSDGLALEVYFDGRIELPETLSADLGPGVKVEIEKDPETREDGDPELRIVYEEGAPTLNADSVLCAPAPGARRLEGLAEQFSIPLDELRRRSIPGREPDLGEILCCSASERVEKDPQRKGRIKIVTTSDDVDRMGDILTIDGWVLKHYSKNPIVLFNHQYGAVGDSPPSQARAVELIVQRKRIVAVDQFHLRTKFNLELHDMYTSDPPMMNTASVGFWPLERPEAIQDGEGRVTGYTFGKKDYLEHSLVAVPANPFAFALALQKGIARPRTLEYLESLALSFAGSTRHGAGEKSHNADRDREAALVANALRVRALST